MLLHRGFEGPRPSAVLVNDGGFSWPGEREREVAVSSLRALHEYAVDLENSLDHRRVGSGGTPSSDRTGASMRPRSSSHIMDSRRVSTSDSDRTSAHQTLSSAADMMGVDERGVEGMPAASPGTGDSESDFHREPARRSSCGKTVAGNPRHDVSGRREGPAGQ